MTAFHTSGRRRDARRVAATRETRARGRTRSRDRGAHARRERERERERERVESNRWRDCAIGLDLIRRRHVARRKRADAKRDVEGDDGVRGGDVGLARVVGLRARGARSPLQTKMR